MDKRKRDALRVARKIFPDARLIHEGQPHPHLIFTHNGAEISIGISGSPSSSWWLLHLEAALKWIKKGVLT